MELDSASMVYEHTWPFSEEKKIGKIYETHHVNLLVAPPMEFLDL